MRTRSQANAQPCIATYTPGGIAEMSLTAKMLALGVPVVTVFHVARVVFLVLAGNLVYRLIAARVGWPHVHARRAPVRAGDDDGVRSCGGGHAGGVMRTAPAATRRLMTSSG